MHFSRVSQFLRKDFCHTSEAPVEPTAPAATGDAIRPEPVVAVIRAYRRADRNNPTDLPATCAPHQADARSPDGLPGSGAGGAALLWGALGQWK
jgi:hypothetical protein